MARRPPAWSFPLLAVVGSSVAFLCAPGRVPNPEVAVTELSREYDPDPAVAVIADRIRVKDELIRELVAGRATLREVTDRFLALNADFPAIVTATRIRFPGLSDREMSARSVLGYVRLEGLPGEDISGVEARLAEEYAREFGPEVPPATAPGTVLTRERW